jgi:hypothetical protein
MQVREGSDGIGRSAALSRKAAECPTPCPTRRLPACADWELPPEGTRWEDWNPTLCAFCNGRSSDPVLDHDHGTGYERGYICRRCNRMESIAWDESHALGPAWHLWRLGCNPATLVGPAEPYEGWGWRGGRNVAEEFFKRTEPSEDADLQAALDSIFKRPSSLDDASPSSS